ncbi:hypothetical protein CRUP_012890 [Coryphaenoides rupestris]|nr:hypothetical protein CRUP_012890 [Coryphaenoides rupestris]
MSVPQSSTNICTSSLERGSEASLSNTSESFLPVWLRLHRPKPKSLFTNTLQRIMTSVLLEEGGSELHVEQQEITGFEGGNVEVKCQHKKNGKEKKSWCRLGSCPGTQDPSRVTIDGSNNGFFVVTMMDLRMESSGWYMCVYGELNMPVHLTVSKPPTTRPTTAFLPHSVASSTVATFSEVASSGDTTVEEPFQSVLMPVLISLGILLFIISVALLVWWMLHRQAKSKRTAMTGGITERSETNGDMVYSTVCHASGVQNSGLHMDDMKHMPNLEAEDQVTYTDIITKPRQR